MSRALVCVEVFRDSGRSAVVTVFQDGQLIDKPVTVMPGDCLDLDLEDGMGVFLRPMPIDDEERAIFAAQEAALKAEMEEAS